MELNWSHEVCAKETKIKLKLKKRFETEKLFWNWEKMFEIEKKLTTKSFETKKKLKLEKS